VLYVIFLSLADYPLQGKFKICGKPLYVLVEPRQLEDVLRCEP